MHQPPATGFHNRRARVNGSEFAQNNIKRIVTKSGHRITLVDTPGKETISIATPTSNRLMLTESHADTGNRPAIVLESAGDIIMAAPNGRIHTQSMHRSAEVGVGGTATKAGNTALQSGATAASAAAANKTSAAKPAAKHLDRHGKPRPTYKGTFPGDVVSAAQRSQAKTGIPASVTLAQWATESGYGRHLPPDSNNPFGIKAKPGEPYVTAMTTEHVNGQDVRVPQNFRKYGSIDDAFDQHGQLLADKQAYAPARAALPDTHAFADQLTGVYATDPHYGEKLGYVMDDNHLTQYDSVQPTVKPNP